MLLSELIKNCNELLNEYGDGEVFFPYQGNLYEPSISKNSSLVYEWIDEDCEIVYDNDNDWKYILDILKHR